MVVNPTILTLLGFGMVVTFMVLILTNRLSPLVALTQVPIVFALVAVLAVFAAFAALRQAIGLPIESPQRERLRKSRAG